MKSMLILSSWIQAYSTCKLAGEEGGQVITCVAPTKTFNLAGVQAAVMIAKDEELREALATKRVGSRTNGIKCICLHLHSYLPITSANHG